VLDGCTVDNLIDVFEWLFPRIIYLFVVMDRSMSNERKGDGCVQCRQVCGKAGSDGNVIR